MKQFKLFLLGTLMSLTMFSCSEDKSVTPEIEKTAVAFVLKEKPSASKVVERGSIPLYVESVKIKATSLVATSTWSVEDTFTFADPGPGVSAFMSLDNVAIGLNKFEASSTSAAANKLFILKKDNQTIAQMQAKTPYITTVSDPKQQEIFKNGIQDVALNMTTQNGRIIALFKLEGEAKKYSIVITAKADGIDVPGETVIVDDEHATFEWTNENAIAGKKVIFTIRICEKGKTTVLSTFTKELTIGASKSIYCTYVITDKDVKTEEGLVRFVITFPKIVEEGCEDNYDDNGYNCHGYNKDGKDKDGKHAFDDCGYHKINKWLYQKKWDKTPNDNGTVKCSN